MITLDDIAVVHADHRDRSIAGFSFTAVDMVELGKVYHKPKVTYIYREKVSDDTARCGATGVFVNLDLALVQQTDIRPCRRCYR